MAIHDAYTDAEKKDLVLAICSIIEDGDSLRTALKELALSSSSFFKWIKDNNELAKRYAGACDIRADLIFEEIIEIADTDDDITYYDNHGNQKIDWGKVQRNKTQIDARKWILAKMKPKKYGDAATLKLADNNGDALKVNAIFTNDLLHVPTDEGTQENSPTEKEH